MSRALLDKLLEPFGLYAAYELDEAEHVVTVEMSTPDVVQELKHYGYGENAWYLEALKYHWETGEPHAFSLRKFDPKNPLRQYHVHGFEVDGCVDIASHWEFRPDLYRIRDAETGIDESVEDAIARLRTHYRPGRDDDYIEGKHLLSPFIDDIARGQDTGE